MTSSATIDDLPAEVICCEILSKLHLSEIINCNLVSKRFCAIVSDFRAKRLTIRYPDNAEASKEPSIEVCHPNLFLSQLNKPLLSQLRSLKIENYPDDFDLNCVNCFSELRHLNIQNANDLKSQIELRLPNLLDFEFIYNGGCQLLLDTVKLERLVYDQGSNAHGPLGSLELVHPESITTLETHFHGEQLKPFKNVRHLRSSREFKVFYPTTLTYLPNLQSINYTVAYPHIFDHFGSWDSIIPTLKSFMDQKRSLKRTDLRVFFGGLELSDHKAIDDYKFEEYSENLERFYLSNYEHLVGIQPVYTVNYSNLMNHLASDSSFNTADRQIPDDYFSRFQLVDRVKVHSRVDQKHFIWFLKCLKSGIGYLNLENSLLDQSFYEQLPALCSPSLKGLTITEKESLIRTWNFIGELKQIISLSLDLELSVPQVNSLLNLIKDREQFYLYFRFRSKKCKVCIETDYFVFRFDQKLVDGVESVNEVIEYLTGY